MHRYKGPESTLNHAWHALAPDGLRTRPPRRYAPGLRAPRTSGTALAAGLIVRSHLCAARRPPEAGAYGHAHWEGAKPRINCQNWMICAHTRSGRSDPIIRAYSAFGVSASARGIAVAVTPGNNGEPAPRRALPAPRASAASVCASAQNRRAPAPDAPSAARTWRRADAIGPASLRAGPPPRAARPATRSRRSFRSRQRFPRSQETTTANGATGPG
jgi:hypothetical protein